MPHDSARPASSLNQPRTDGIASAAADDHAYLAVLALVALYVKPPLIGWIGLVVVAVVAVAIATGAAFLFPRISANVAPATSVKAADLLVVAAATCSSDRLREAVVAHMNAREVPVYVVAPVLSSPLPHWLEGDLLARIGDLVGTVEHVVVEPQFVTG